MFRTFNNLLLASSRAISIFRSFSSLLNTQVAPRILERQSGDNESCASLMQGNHQAIRMRSSYRLPRYRVAVITGGTTGIGFAVAHELLAEGTYCVILTGLGLHDDLGTVTYLNSKFGMHKALYYQADVVNPYDVENLFYYVVSKFKKFDILFNNAGVWSEGNWERSIDVNIVGVVQNTLTALKYFDRSRCPGIVINCASTLSFDAAPPSPAYSATQHGIIGFTRSIGAPFHCQKKGHRIMALCPGITLTKMPEEASVHKNHFLREYTRQWINERPAQDVGAVARAFVDMLKHGESGEIYVVENSKHFLLNPPMRREASQFVANIPTSARAT